MVKINGISVVICSYNSAKVIKPTIIALSNQIIPDDDDFGFEVILVNNNCTDETIKIAKDNWKSDYPLKIIDELNPGIVHARKAGVMNVKYDITLFVDDDNILNNDWLVKLNEDFNKMPDVGLIGGYNIPLLEGKKPKWFDEYQQKYACGSRIKNKNIDIKNNDVIKKYYLFGAGLAFRTEILKKIYLNFTLFLTGRTKNVFLRGDDTELVYIAFIMGWKFYYNEKLILKHFILKEKLSLRFVEKFLKSEGIASIILQNYRNVIYSKSIITYDEKKEEICKNEKLLFKEILLNPFQLFFRQSKLNFRIKRLIGRKIGLVFYNKEKFTKLYNSLNELRKLYKLNL